MKAIEDRRALIRINEAADRCFGACIDGFEVTRQIRPSEERCVHSCTVKFVELSSLVGQIFAEQSGL